MGVREKLVELIEPHMSGLACEYESGSCELTSCRSCNARNIAGHLIANGVTVQNWISVKERLPQENEPEGTLCETVQVLLNNGKVSVGWCNRITKLWWHMDYDKDYFISKDYDHTPVIAWQPLAQPPKGE